MSTAEFVRICDLKGLEVGDLLWVERKAPLADGPLYILPPNAELGLRAFFVTKTNDRRDLENDSPGWRIHVGGRNAQQEVKVLRRLRGVTKDEVSNARWDATVSRLMHAPAFASESTAPELPKPGSPITVEQARGLPPGSVIDTQDGTQVPLLVCLRPDGWAWGGENSHDGAGTMHVANAMRGRDNCVYLGQLPASALSPRAASYRDAIAALGWVPAHKRVKSTPASLKVGDTLTDPDAAPVGTFAEVARLNGRAWGFVKTSDGWETCSPENRTGTGEYASLDEGLHPSTRSDLERGKVVALLPPEATTSRRAVVTALAALGHEGAKKRMAAEVVPLKVGDVVPASRAGEVPEGACVQSGNYSHSVWRRIGDKWQTVSFSGEFAPSDALGHACAYGDVAANLRLIALNCKATDRVGLARELAAQGWSPASAWLQHHHGAIVRMETPAEPATPPMPKPGDKLTATPSFLGTSEPTTAGVSWAAA